MIAIISDVHSNLIAWQAVLDDIAKLDPPPEAIYSLGDMVGYGWAPEECLALAEEREVQPILGNHGGALICEPLYKGANPDAREALEFTRGKLTHGRIDSFRRYPISLEVDLDSARAVLVHGAPFNNAGELDETTPDPRVSTYMDVTRPEKHPGRERLAKILGSMTTDYCFCGHSHKPGVFELRGDELKILTLNDMELMPGRSVFILDGGKAIINVGSVGQPRDLDPRACYATVHDELVRFHKVKYDVAAASLEIIKAGLNLMYAQRLSKGK